MNKTIKFFLILVGALLFLPIKANAAGGSLSFTCNKLSLSPGKTMNCTISTNSDSGVSTVSGTITPASKMTVVSVTPLGAYSGDYDMETGELNLSSESPQTGRVEAFSITLTFASDASAEDESSFNFKGKVGTSNSNLTVGGANSSKGTSSSSGGVENPSTGIINSSMGLVVIAGCLFATYYFVIKKNKIMKI